MTRVMVELSMSLDGYVTGPDVSPEEPTGRGGEALHDWMFKGRSAAESEENAHYSGIGAVIVDAGWPIAACGAASGMLVHTCAVVLGLAAVLRAAPMAMDLLRFAGAAYLLWLALRSLRTSELAPGVPGLPMPDRFGPVFLRGLINNLANPKIVLFYVAFLPQFVDPSLGRQTLQLFVLGLTLLALGMAIDLAIGGGAARVGFLRRHRAANRWLNRFAGTVYGALAVRLVLSDPT